MFRGNSFSLGAFLGLRSYEFPVALQVVWTNSSQKQHHGWCLCLWTRTRGPEPAGGLKLMEGFHCETGVHRADTFDEALEVGFPLYLRSESCGCGR